MSQSIIVLGEEICGFHSIIPPDAEWAIYDYETGHYDGSGTAYAGNSKGRFWSTSLGHCSCYGPLEDDDRYTPRSWDEGDSSDMLMHLTGCSMRWREAFKSIGINLPEPV